MKDPEILLRIIKSTYNEKYTKKQLKTAQIKNFNA
jgi:hypothetical protein